MLHEVHPSLLEKYNNDSLIYMDDNNLAKGPDVPENIAEDIRNKEIQIYGGYYKYRRAWESPKIFLICRGKKSGKVKLKIEGFQPYCYVPDRRGKYLTYTGEKVEKLIFKTKPNKVAYFRRKAARVGHPIPLEADVRYVRRFLIDMYDYFKPKEAFDPKFAIIDIETDHPKSKDLISFAFNDPEGDLYYNDINIDDNQTTFHLSLDAYEKMKPFDIIGAWNSDFDIGEIERFLKPASKALMKLKGKNPETLEEAIKILTDGKVCKNIPRRGMLIDALIEYGYLDEEFNVIKTLDPDISHMISILDLLEVSKKMNAHEIKGGWDLGNVGYRKVHMGKYDTGEQYPRNLDPDSLLWYNCIDTIVPELLDDYFGGVMGQTILAWSLQMRLQDVMITAVVNDIAILRAYHNAGLILPSRRYEVKDDDDETYDAARPDARRGLYHDLVMFDLAAAYPNIVLALNASTETKDENGDIVAPNGVRFRHDKTSVFIDTLFELLNERNKVKKKLKEEEKGSNRWRKLKSVDFALKTQTAAFSHGIYGWTNSRMKDIPTADSITAVAREQIQSIKDRCDEIGLPWVYSHTDSVIVNSPEKFKNYLEKELNGYLKEWSESRGYLKNPRLEFEDFFEVGYIHTPARNILVPYKSKIDDYPEDDLAWKVTGMNFMRSEVPEVLADIEIELYKLKLKGKSQSDIVNRLRELVLKMSDMDTTKLGITKPLNKKIEDYGRKLKDGSIGGHPYHIKALMKAQKEDNLKVPIGSKFMILPVMSKETKGKRVIRRKKKYVAFDMNKGLPDKHDIDFERYFRDNLYGKVNEMIGLSVKELEEELGIDWSFDEDYPELVKRL